jgi:hypothetical protein
MHSLLYNPDAETIPMNNVPKLQYSEHEAAHMLGVSVDELRGLVRAHIVNGDESADPAVPAYHKADLVLLRVLTRMVRPSEARHV